MFSCKLFEFIVTMVLCAELLSVKSTLNTVQFESRLLIIRRAPLDCSVERCLLLGHVFEGVFGVFDVNIPLIGSQMVIFSFHRNDPFKTDHPKTPMRA